LDGGPSTRPIGNCESVNLVADGVTGSTGSIHSHLEVSCLIFPALRRLHVERGLTSSDFFRMLRPLHVARARLPSLLFPWPSVLLPRPHGPGAGLQRNKPWALASRRQVSAPDNRKPVSAPDNRRSVPAPDNLYATTSQAAYFRSPTARLRARSPVLFLWQFWMKSTYFPPKVRTIVLL